MEPSSQSDSRVRVAQIIIGAMAMGLTMFGVIVVYLVRSGTTAANTSGQLVMIGHIAKGVLLAGIIAGWVLWKVWCRRAGEAARGLDDERRAADAVFPLFQAGLILRAALLEGPGLLCIVVAMLTHDLWMLAYGGVAVAGFLAIFPTQATFARFVRDAMGVA